MGAKVLALAVACLIGWLGFLEAVLKYSFGKLLIIMTSFIKL